MVQAKRKGKGEGLSKKEVKWMAWAKRQGKWKVQTKRKGELKVVNNVVAGSRFERVGSVIPLANCHKPWQTSKLLPHVFETPTHLWNQKFQKFQYRDPLKTGCLSGYNQMKEGERVLFQPLPLKRYRRGLHCGHFAISTDLIPLIL